MYHTRDLYNIIQTTSQFLFNYMCITPSRLSTMLVCMHKYSSWQIDKSQCCGIMVQIDGISRAQVLVRICANELW